MNVLKYHWCETSLFLAQAVLKHVVVKDFIFKKSVQGTGSSLYPAKNEEIYGIVPYQKFFMSCYISYTFNKENFNMWVTGGSYGDHIRIAL